MSYMSFVAGGDLSGGIKYAVGECPVGEMSHTFSDQLVVDLSVRHGLGATVSVISVACCTVCSIFLFCIACRSTANAANTVELVDAYTRRTMAVRTGEVRVGDSGRQVGRHDASLCGRFVLRSDLSRRRCVPRWRRLLFN